MGPALPDADLTDILPPIQYEPQPRVRLRPGIAAGWCGVAILLLIAAGIAALDWRILGWG